MSDLTADDIIQSVKANSEQINGDDLIAGTITGRIVRVTKGTTEQPVFVYLDTVQGKSFRPCKSERRIMIEMWGEDPSAWKGQAVRLHRDPSAKWEGKPVGGVRIEAATIARPLVTSSTVSRGRSRRGRLGCSRSKRPRSPHRAGRRRQAPHQGPVGRGAGGVRRQPRRVGRSARHRVGAGADGRGWGVTHIMSVLADGIVVGWFIGHTIVLICAPRGGGA